MTEPTMGAAAPLRSFLRTWFLLPVGVVLFALTLTLGLIAKSYGSFSPDLALDVDLSQARNPVMTAVGLGLNYGLGPVGAITILVLICAWLAFIRRAPIRAMAFGSITVAGWLSSEIGKATVARVRPPAGAVHALVSQTGHDSFPSGHTAFAASLAWAVILVLARHGLQRRLAIVAGVLFTAAVGLSRMYIGVHYPTDVVGGALISTAGILIWLAVWINVVEPRLRGTKAFTRITRSDASIEKPGG